jgi:intracellular multiplication protein IcmE
MSTENDAGRDIKLTIGIVLGVVVILVCGGYFLWSWLAAPPPAKSQLDINRVAGASRSYNAESPEYRELLRKSNKDGGSEARQKNSSFIASIAAEQEPVDSLPVSTAKPAVAKPSTARQSQSTQAQASGNQGQSGERSKALEDLLNRIRPPADPKEQPTGLQVAQVVGAAGGAGGEAGTTGSDYQRWSESLPGGARVQARSMNGGLSGPDSAMGAPVEVIPPYWRGPGTIELGVNSDNSTTPVLGMLPTGPYAGAVLKAPNGAKLYGDGVEIHFTDMAFRGKNYKVDAYALHDETLQASVASDVNHRYMSRIVLPALLSGIGGVGEMYSQANTQVVSNGFNTQAIRPGLPDATAVMGAIAGGAAGQAAKVLTEDAARTPATQVTVIKGQVVAIQFMRGVYSGDAIAPGQGGEAVRPSVSATSAPLAQAPTADEWREKTQKRIEEQRRLQEVK